MTAAGNVMARLPSRLDKLRAMSLAEIASRTSYAMLVAVERRQVASDGLGRETESARRRWHDMVAVRRREVRSAFFPSLSARDTLRTLFAPHGPYAAEADKARRVAALAREHVFEFFGQRFAFGPEIDWHADPVTGRAWPKVFHRDVPIHEGSRAIGDVKYVWELNRHQFLIDLGKAYWLFDDDAAASAVYRIVRHWIDANPYGIGVNWSCALEPAFRTWSWLWAYHFCAADPRLDDDTHVRWLRSFDQHGRFLYRHLEYYSSPFNHLIGEASTLYALGLLFPEMPDAARWQKRGRRVLLERLASEFHADGGSVEQSTFYHHATLGFYILASLLGEANGDPFPVEVERAIERGVEFSMRLMQPDGRVPSIGGADDGKCIRLEHLPFWDFRPFQAIGAARYGRGDFRYAAGRFYEDALWLLGPAGRERFDAVPSETPLSAAALRDSGYYVLRSGWTPEADYLCFDCGEQAAGLRTDDVPSAAHGHADCLSVILWLGGRPVLVDPGFFCYNGDPDWEVRFRGTAAHNTAAIDGADQSRHVSKMAWCRVFTPSPEAWIAGPRGGAAGGSHDGYARTAGVVHRRAVWLHESGCALICDQFTGAGSHRLELNFQFAPGAAALSGGSAALFDHAELVWTGTAAVEPRLRCGEADAGGGWIAPSLGVRRPAPRLTLAAEFRAPVTTFLTLAIPRVPGQTRRSTVASGDPELAIGVPVAMDRTEWFGLRVDRPARSAAELIAAVDAWRSARTRPVERTLESCS